MDGRHGQHPCDRHRARTGPGAGEQLACPEAQGPKEAAKDPKRKITWDRVWAQRALLLMAVPLLLYQILFKYVPVYGWAIAFQHYKPGRGSIWNQQWVGFDNFVQPVHRCQR